MKHSGDKLSFSDCSSTCGLTATTSRLFHGVLHIHTDLDIQ